MTRTVDAGRTPAVSILTPTYRHGRYIRECLESVLAQSFTDWELIVIDDGSPDDTVEQAESVRDPRIRVLRREHVGIARLAETYNAGLAVARGRYLAALEGDDRWRPQKLAIQTEIMGRHDVVMAYARYAVIGTHGRVLSVPPLAGPRRRGAYDALGAILLDPFPELVTALIRRDALGEIGGFRQLPGHEHIDYATYVALAERGSFFASGDVVAEWRRHATSATVQAFATQTNFDGPRTCMQHAIAVRRRHPGRDDLPGEAAIERAWQGVLARRYWNGGRVLQAQRHWSEARALFVSGLGTRGASLRQRLLLTVGLVSAVLHLDLERAIATVRGGSPIVDL